MSELKPMPPNINSDRSLFVPIKVSGYVLNIITPDQTAALNRLVKNYKADSAMVMHDSLMQGAILFTLFTSHRGHLVNGLIEPNGDVNT